MAATASDTNAETIHSGRIQESRSRQSGKVEVALEDDGKTTVLKNVLLLGKSSRGTSRADYSDDSLRNGVKLYEEAEVFVGHTYDGTNPVFDRNMGVIRNPVVAADGIRGDHAFPTAHRLREDLVWRAEHAPRNLGYSHDADCSWKFDAKGRKQIHRIDRVFSVDLVTRTGTTGGLREEEEIIPDEQRDFAEHLFSALSDCRSIVTSDGTLAEKRSRLLEEMYALHGELLEGEIGEELAKEAPRRRIREIHGVASRKLDEAMWSSDKYPHHHDLRKRHLDVLSDWSKELKAVQCNCPDCSSGKTQEENHTMDWKDITVDGLKTNCPEVVAKLTGTDEHSRLMEESTTLKAERDTLKAENEKLKTDQEKRIREEAIVGELKAASFPVGDVKVFTTRFKEELLKAKDKAERAEIIKERMDLISGRVQESAPFASPMEELRPLEEVGGRNKPRKEYNRFFGAST